MAHALQRLAAHRGGQSVTVSGRQCGKNQADVGASRDVVRDDEHRSAYSAKILTAQDARMAQDLCGGPSEGVIDREAQPANGFTLRPARIDVFGALSGWLLQDALNIGDRPGAGEGGFVK